MKIPRLRWIACFAVTMLLAGGFASRALAIFPIIAPQVNPEIIIDNQDPPTPDDIPPLPDIPEIPPECECDCEPKINNTPEPATMITALVGVAIGGAYVLRKRLAK